MTKPGLRTMMLWVFLIAVPLLPAAVGGEEVDLSKYERSVYSQSGEDGIIEKIFEIIEPTRKYAVEFGASDGVAGNNMRRLVIEEGWSGLQIEGDERLAAKLAENYADFPGVKTLHAWIYPGNIEILFEENGVPRDFDLLVIDIDSNDYYVWHAIQSFRPKLVQIEYNNAFAPPKRAVVDFHPMNYWDGTDYFGASIQSYYELGKKKGYELVYGNQTGSNLFFVDRKYFDRFELEDNAPERFYRPPDFGLEKGGRAPNGRGFDSFESKPTLRWKTFEIEKKIVER